VPGERIPSQRIPSPFGRRSPTRATNLVRRESSHARDGGGREATRNRDAHTTAKCPTLPPAANPKRDSDALRARTGRLDLRQPILPSASDRPLSPSLWEIGTGPTS